LKTVIELEIDIWCITWVKCY